MQGYNSEIWLSPLPLPFSLLRLSLSLPSLSPSPPPPSFLSLCCPSLLSSPPPADLLVSLPMVWKKEITPSYASHWHTQEPAVNMWAGEVCTWVERRDCRACRERAFLCASASSSRTGVRYDLHKSHTFRHNAALSFPSTHTQKNALTHLRLCLVSCSPVVVVPRELEVVTADWSFFSVCSWGSLEEKERVWPLDLEYKWENKLLNQYKTKYLWAKTLLRRLSPAELVPVLAEVTVGSSSLFP